MPQPTFDPAWIRKIPEHAEPLDAEADDPIRHHTSLTNSAWNLLAYLDRNLARVPNIYEGPLERHRKQLHGMVILSLVEAFERFLKEIAAVCVDALGGLVLDDRFDGLGKGSALGRHLAARNLGRALCESLVWLDCGDINERFGKILADPFAPRSFYVFPKANTNQLPASLRDRHDTMEIIFQLRHTLAHNAGVITESDALQLRLLVKKPLDAPRRLAPTRGDAWYVKMFLDETARLINEEVAKRLAVLLTTLHGNDPSLFDPPAKAQTLANRFRVAAQVAGSTAQPT